MSELKLYVIPKPESAKYTENIEIMLDEAGFRLDKVFSVKNWESLGRRIYKKQLDEGTHDFRMAYEGHIKVSQILFGNESVLIVLKNPYDNMVKGLEKLCIRKQEIRKRLQEEGHEHILICADLLGLNLELFKNYRQEGILGIKNEKDFHPFEDYHGMWDYFYFKFLHVPDPQIESLEREWEIITNIGILSQEIPLDKWQTMKNLKTLVVPK